MAESQPGSLSCDHVLCEEHADRDDFLHGLGVALGLATISSAGIDG
jgi:hypothetical protein